MLLRDAGLIITGKSNAGSGQKVTVKLLDATDSDKEITSYGSHQGSISGDGTWSVTLPKTNFPFNNSTGTFKVKLM